LNLFDGLDLPLGQVMLLLLCNALQIFVFEVIIIIIYLFSKMEKLE